MYWISVVTAGLMCLCRVQYYRAYKNCTVPEYQTRHKFRNVIVKNWAKGLNLEVVDFIFPSPYFSVCIKYKN